jgi:signal peptidase I
MNSPSQRDGNAAVADLIASLQSLLGTIVIAVFVITFVVQAFQIPSESMENTLLIGDYLLVDKAHFADGGFWGKILPYTTIHRGDIVVFHYPVDPRQHFVKRVIGLPGDHVRISGRQVWVNERPLREEYAQYSRSPQDGYRYRFPNLQMIDPSVEAAWWKEMPQVVNHGELVVPRGEYFVLGDNRDRSLDSRYWGFVPRQNIIGRPLLIYWSVDAPEGDAAVGDKLARFAYLVTHPLETTRWKRAFRVVN